MDNERNAANEGESRSYTICNCIDCGNRRKVDVLGTCSECRSKLDIRIKKIRSKLERGG